MSGTAVFPAIVLGDRFARELPELAIAWRAERAPDPRLLVLNGPLAERLGLDPAWLRGPDGLALLTGAQLPEGARPVAQGYAGHQFGGYSPRLGDGRALLLGELADPDGRPVDLHLKGSGRTPFARGGDGLAAVGPMLREYVVSEAMHALGIPTTRSLAVVATGARVQRETELPGAVLARVAASHLRVGSFQYARATDDLDLLRRLADHAIDRHHPAAAAAEHPYRALYAAVVDAQARLIAQWMLVGFVHGVMNTDNMTISGESIDFGPCAFLDAFDPATVFSSIDEGGRYAYGNQPAVGQWNLARLAEALLPLLADDEQDAVAVATELLGGYAPAYRAVYAAGLRRKFGLPDGLPDGLEDAVAGTLIDQALTQMEQSRVDFTGFFRDLAAAARGDAEPARSRFLDLAAFDDWLARWRALDPDPDAMGRVNPVYIPRNHLVEQALAAAVDGDLDPLHHLLAAVTDPYRARPGFERYADPAPEDFGDYRTFCGT
ncbi:protein adenylyltransferase SelO [Nakamurella sp.]|uniref:protein adenylyltransferase SelO n=1 Tax=Nakamurella sp. TaxID=1869182 RepID=UPI003B3B70A3